MSMVAILKVCPVSSFHQQSADIFSRARVLTFFRSATIHIISPLASELVQCAGTLLVKLYELLFIPIICFNNLVRSVLDCEFMSLPTERYYTFFHVASLVS